MEPRPVTCYTLSTLALTCIPQACQSLLMQEDAELTKAETPLPSVTYARRPLSSWGLVRGD